MVWEITKIAVILFFAIIFVIDILVVMSKRGG